MNSKNHKKTLLTFLCVFFILNIAKSNDYNKSVYDAYLSESAVKWELLISNYTKTEDLSVKEKKIELISFYYGYISLLLKEKNYDETEINIQKSEFILTKALKESPNNSTLNSFKAAYIGFHITISKLSAIYLASESNKYIDKALSLEPDNCQALIDKGNILLHTPTIFGGDKEQAIIYYTKAFKLFEKRNQTKNNWLYINTLDNLIKAYTRTEQTEKANIISKKRNLIIKNNNDI